MKTSFLIFVTLLFAYSRSWGVERDSVATDSITKALGEVVVTAQTVSHQGNRDAYVLTKDMKQGLKSAGELLSRIPDLQYNPLSKAVKYMGSSNIVILMDSVEKSEEFIKNLSPNRFDRIDVVHNPTGKYTGYDAVINFHTRPTYEGYDGYAGSQVMWYPINRKLNDSGIGKTTGYGGLSYTREKWTINVDASYLRQNTYSMGYYSKYYIVNDRTETTLKQDRNHPGQKFSDDRLWGGVAIDYQINNNHSLSASWRINSYDALTDVNQKIAIRDIPASIADTIDYRSANNTNNSLSNTIGLYYRGRFGAWQLNSSATYTMSGWDKCYDVERSDGYKLSDYRDVSSRYFWGGFDLFRGFANHRWQVSLSEYLVALNYTEDLIGSNARLSDNSVIQNNLLASVMFSPTRQFSAVVNAGAYYYRNSEGGRHVESWSPRIDINMFWRPSNTVTARLNYSLQTSMPGLSLISSYGQFTDSLEYQIGNPILKASKNHIVSLSLTLLNSLTFKANYTRGDNAFYNITSLDYMPLADGSMMPYAYNRYENGRREQWSFGIYYNKRLTQHFELTASADLTGRIARYDQYRQEKWIPTTDIMLTYRNQKLGMAAYFNYAIMADKAVVTPQSKTWGTQDGFSIAAEKYLWNDRLEIMLMWFPALHLVDGDSKGVYRSPAIEKKTWGNGQYRSNNMLSIAFTLRFNGGDKVRKYQRNTYSVTQ